MPCADQVCEQALQKTRMCNFYRKGCCSKGSQCSFAHSPSQLQQRPNLSKTRLCIPFQHSGVCDMGPGCRFAHSENEVRGIKPVMQEGKSKKSRAARAAQAIQILSQAIKLPDRVPDRQDACFRNAFPQSCQSTLDTLSPFNSSCVTTEATSSKDESSEDSQGEGSRTPTGSDGPDQRGTPVKLMDFLEMSSTSHQARSGGHDEVGYKVPLAHPYEVNHGEKTGLATAQSDIDKDENSPRKCNKWDDHNLYGARGCHPTTGLHFIVRNTFLEFEEEEPLSRTSLQRSSSAHDLVGGRVDWP